MALGLAAIRDRRGGARARKARYLNELHVFGKPLVFSEREREAQRLVINEFARSTLRAGALHKQLESVALVRPKKQTVVGQSASIMASVFLSWQPLVLHRASVHSLLE